MPGLMILRATVRRTGCCCSAMKTTPKPPSPICSSSLYGPICVPGQFGEPSHGTCRHAGGRRHRESWLVVVHAEQRFHAASKAVSSATGLLDVTGTGPPRPLSRLRVKDGGFVQHGMRS